MQLVFWYEMKGSCSIVLDIFHPIHVPLDVTGISKIKTNFAILKIAILKKSICQQTKSPFVYTRYLSEH